MPDEPEDEGARGRPPHPLDRVWFHPSELSAYMAATPAGGSRPRREWGFTAIAAMLGALATVGILAATGALDGDGRVSSPAGLATAVSALGDDPVARLVAESGGSVVAVRAASETPSDRIATASGVALARNQVLTTASALTGATRISVSTDGQVLAARLLGTDPETDLAVLRVEGGDLSPARLGSSDELVVGQAVVALGLMSGDHRWAGTGVVSALDRLAVTTSGTLMPGLVETDLRPGTAVAGGALLDASGAVVGILSGAAPGNALPIEWARGIAEQLTTSGRARHGWLGIDTVDADDRPGGGARVTAVADGGPAAAAGVAPGDVVTALGDERVTDMADLLAAAARRRPGDPVTVVLWRDGHRLSKTADLGERS